MFVAQTVGNTWPIPKVSSHHHQHMTCPMAMMLILKILPKSTFGSKNFFVFDWNRNLKCLGEKSVSNHQNILFLVKKQPFFGATHFDNRGCKGRAARAGSKSNGRPVVATTEVARVGQLELGRRATGGLLLGLAEEQQGGLLLPGLAPGRIYSV